METKQTAVEWFRSELTRCHTATDERIAYRIAKAMEKEQIEKAYESGCIGEMWELNFTHSANQYYEKTYGK